MGGWVGGNAVFRTTDRRQNILDFLYLPFNFWVAKCLGRELFIHEKAMVPNVQLSTNCELDIILITVKNIF